MRARRLLLGVAGVMVLWECGLRYSGPLPSLRSVPQPFEAAGYPSVKAIGPEPVGCVEVDTGQPPPLAWRWMTGEGTDEPLTMLIVGDSVAAGRGLEPSDTWAGVLAQRLAEANRRPVDVHNAAVNASGYCGAFRTIHHYAAHHDFDRVVVGLFADDLEQRAVVVEDGAIYANPDNVPGVVGFLASHSHVFNALWLHVLRTALTHGGREMPSQFLGSGRSVPKSVLDNFSESISRVVDYEPLFLVNSPAGMGFCSSSSAPSDCDWLRADMAHLARVLDESGEVWVDNRTLFDEETTRTTLPEERDWLERRGRLPVHPNAAGHRMIAQTVPEAWLVSPPSVGSDD